MRQTLLCLFVMVLLALATGCRTNLLPEYKPKLAHAAVITIAETQPVVSIGSSKDNGVVGMFNDVAAIGTTVSMQERLVKLLDGEALAISLTETFESSMQASLGIAVVDDTAEHDSRIEIAVNGFGLEAQDMEHQVYYFFDTDVRMVFIPENKLIWEYHTVIHEPIKEVHILGGLLGAGINLGTLGDMKDEELIAIFGALAQEAGAELADQMRIDSAN